MIGKENETKLFKETNFLFKNKLLIENNSIFKKSQKREIGRELNEFFLENFQDNSKAILKIINKRLINSINDEKIILENFMKIKEKYSDSELFSLTLKEYEDKVNFYFVYNQNEIEMNLKEFISKYEASIEILIAISMNLLEILKIFQSLNIFLGEISLENFYVCIDKKDVNQLALKIKIDPICFFVKPKFVKSTITHYMEEFTKMKVTTNLQIFGSLIKFIIQVFGGVQQKSLSPKQIIKFTNQFNYEELVSTLNGFAISLINGSELQLSNFQLFLDKIKSFKSIPISLKQIVDIPHKIKKLNFIQELSYYRMEILRIKFEIKIIKKIYRDVDRTGTGILSQNLLRYLYEGLANYKNFSENEMGKILDRSTIYSAGNIYFNEFINEVFKDSISIYQKNLQIAFDNYDFKNNKYINVEDINDHLNFLFTKQQLEALDIKKKYTMNLQDILNLLEADCELI